MKDEKRLYICYTIIYVFVVVTIYNVIQGFPATTIEPGPFFRAILSSFGPAFLLVLVVNIYIWRWAFFRKILGIKTPYIHGRWEGYIRSIYTEHRQKHTVAVEFWQTLHKINIWYYDENAITNSLVADFSTDAEGGPYRLYCVYRNQPIKTDQKNLQVHSGVMDLLVRDEGKTIIGIYYNNPHQRSTYGEIILNFVDRKLSRQLKRDQH